MFIHSMCVINCKHLRYLDFFLFYIECLTDTRVPSCLMLDYIVLICNGGRGQTTRFMMVGRKMWGKPKTIVLFM